MAQIEIPTCPRCGAVWGFDEIEFEQCDACGYPEPEEDNNEDDYDEYDEYYDDYK